MPHVHPSSPFYASHRALHAALLLGLLTVVACTRASAREGAAETWIPLFNGRNLDGWTVKVAKHPLGVNHADTFRVEDGVIKVAYDRYGAFDEQFAHLYTNNAYSRYVLRLEYRFTGTAIPDAPPWAKRNSGVMLHCQSPLSLDLNQLWPVCMEFQFLCVGTAAGRQSGNVCTPGTNLERGGRLLTEHIIEATSELSPMDEWIPIEVEVRGNDEIIHRIRGVEVLRYQRPQLDPKDPAAQALLAAGVPLQLNGGHIALQAEGQPVWFRNIRIRVLE